MQHALGYRSSNDRPVFATIGMRNQGWEITGKSFRFPDFAALADIDANVLGINVEMIITSEGDNGILFEGTEGRFFVNRGKITGKPVEDLKDNPLPDGAIEEIYGGPVSSNHRENFTDAIKSRKQPISDVWSHNRMLEICHLSNIAMRLNRPLAWDATKREIIGDDVANSFLTRENRKGFEIEM